MSAHELCHIFIKHEEYKLCNLQTSDGIVAALLSHFELKRLNLGHCGIIRITSLKCYPFPFKMRFRRCITEKVKAVSKHFTPLCENLMSFKCSILRHYVATSVFVAVLQTYQYDPFCVCFIYIS